MDEFFARNRLSAYIDGELSDTEMAEVARAIEEQPEVRQAYRELLDAVELLREHGPVQAPSRFHADVMRRVEELPAARGWFSWLLRPLGRYPMQGLGVAVVAAAVLLLVFRGPDFGDLSSPEPAPVTVPDVEREAAAPGLEAQQEDARGSADDGQNPTTSADLERLPDSVQEQGVVSELGSKGTDKPISSSGRKTSPTSKEAEEAVPIETLLKSNKGATYIPEWDKEQVPTGTTSLAPEPASGEEGAGSLATSPYAYRLTPNSPDVLRRLEALAAKLGGSVHTTSGEVFDPYILTVERNHAQVVLHIPASRLESVEPYLTKMGGLVTVSSDQDRLFAVDAVEVTVEVLYQP